MSAPAGVTEEDYARVSGRINSATTRYWHAISRPYVGVYKLISGRKLDILLAIVRVDGILRA